MGPRSDHPGSADVEVSVHSEELEAEIARSRLAAEGIPARISPKSQIGMPASWSPLGLGYGIGSFSVRVPREYARLAHEAIGDVEHPRRPDRHGAMPREAIPRAPKPRAHLVVRLVATAILLYFLIGTAIWLAQMLPAL